MEESKEEYDIILYNKFKKIANKELILEYKVFSNLLNPFHVTPFLPYRIFIVANYYGKHRDDVIPIYILYRWRGNNLRI